MKVTFLGTGTSQGVPVIACKCSVCRSSDPKDKRLRTSVLVEIEGLTFAIDSGPDFRQQMLRENVGRLDAILFTHEHKDHIAGLDDVRAFNFVLSKPIDVFMEKKVRSAIEREFAYVFEEEDNKYPGVPRININIIENRRFMVNGMGITPVRAFHYKLPVFGFRIGDFTYITDANYIPDREKEKIQGSRVIVINALRKESHISHFTLSEAVQLLKEMNPESGYITHISHQMGLHSEVSGELPEGINLAWDGLKIEID